VELVKKIHIIFKTKSSTIQYVVSMPHIEFNVTTFSVNSNHI